MAVFDPSALLALPHDVSVLRALDVGVRAQILESRLCRTLGRALGVPPAHRIPADRPLRVLGVDSLLALHLKQQLERALRVRTVAHDQLREATLAQLAALLAEEVARPQEAAAAGVAGR
ncbi:acyl carrier protein [Streptomyces sp. KL118A]|uniref:acyl carrier protein n=1 Tax=Streptomyces sp. KL118A TaxID=3045153 RepID=UPI00278BCB9A|nr:acyl carrier protein [Streptomyces sp. KL118A]